MPIGSLANLIQKSDDWGIDTMISKNSPPVFVIYRMRAIQKIALADFNKKIKNVKAYDVDTGIGRSLKFVGWHSQPPIWHKD